MVDVKIIYKNNKPYGIRDESGFLFFFTDITKYSGQENRYRQEVAEQYNLADDLCIFLESRNSPKENIESANTAEAAKNNSPQAKIADEMESLVNRDYDFGYHVTNMIRGWIRQLRALR